MSKRRARTAAWFVRRERGKRHVYVVRPADWPKKVELSFTERDQMIDWARGARVMLKDVSER